MKRLLLALPIVFLLQVAAAKNPNIVFIFADDMGYGDIGAYNPESKIPTPNLDKLAVEGMRFTDAHAAGSWCVPSRYGLLTGRYPWRYPHRMSVGGYSGLIIEPERLTLGSLLQKNGYHTACIGKWHQGLGPREEGTDYSGEISPSGNQAGFDYFYVHPASLDIPPYVYVENDKTIAPLDATVPDNETPGMRWAAGAFWRGGKAMEGFDFEEVLPHLRDKAVTYVKEQAAEEDKPFFLYFPLTAPHTPWMPTEEYKGKSGAGMYGDFVAQVDGVVGDVLEAIEEAGAKENTLVFFASDNGAFWVEEEKEEFDHLANGPWRGQKGDIWEGGHRMPLIARWPGTVPAGSVRGDLLSFTDMLATFAAIVDDKLPDDSGEDSINMLPVLQDAQLLVPSRSRFVHQAGPGHAIRDGNWKLITFLGSGGFTKPKRVDPEEGGPTGQLYNLAKDPGETSNLYQEHPEIVARLEKLLEESKQAGRSRPRE